MFKNISRRDIEVWVNTVALIIIITLLTSIHSIEAAEVVVGHATNVNVNDPSSVPLYDVLVGFVIIGTLVSIVWALAITLILEDDGCSLEYPQGKPRKRIRKY